MSDDLRAAAERVIRMGDDTTYWHDTQAVMDAERLARAWLAAHPSDAAEPATEARLLALPGATKPTAHSDRIRIGGGSVALDLFPWRGGYSAEVREAGGGRGALALDVRTMGQVRGLLAALGITGEGT